MEGKSNDLFLLMTHLSQLNNIKNLKKVFSEGLNTIFQPAKFIWSDADENESLECIEIRTSFNHLGYLKIVKKIDPNSYPLFQNAIQVFAVYIERIQQNELLENKGIKLEEIIEANTKELKLKNEKLKTVNEEYEALHEEYKTLNEELIGKNEELNYTVKELHHQNLRVLISEELLNATSKMAELGGWEYNPQIGEVRWSDSIREVFEIDEDINFTLEDSFDFFIENDKQKISNFINQAITNGYAFDCELQIETAKKNKIWVRAVGNPEMEANKCVNFWGIYQNISKQKKNELALKASDDFNRMLFNTSIIGLALTDIDGKLIDVNPAYANIIGQTVEECKKLKYWDITPEKYSEQEQLQLESLAVSGLYGPYDKEYIHKNGHLVPVRLQGSIIERDGKKFIWSSVEDITQ
ncbi:MAG: PAS domain S-box protein [Salinivirgaceae bacterium]|jgi:PAS domain S-box-containing protein|nr:PAS domain S-box protein [Salinivirgaceae bacterium]